jgi:hypothetical protein
MLVKIARLSLVAGTAVLALSQESSASACSLSPCSASVRVPNETLIPGNLVYFEVLADDASLALHTSAGVPIAAQVRDLGGKRVFVPDETIPELSEVVLEYTTVCIGDFGPDIPSTFTFTTSAAAEVKLRPATLELRERGIEYLPRAEEHSFVRLLYGTPDATGSAAQLLTTEATVDGDALHFVDVGGLSMVELSTRCSPPANERLIDTCGIVLSVPPGKHVVEVRTAVLGQANDPEPARLEVDVSCPSSATTDAGDSPKPAPTGNTQHAEQLDDTPARTDTSTPPSRKTSVPSGPDVVATPNDSGCALSAHDSAGSRGAGALAAVALALTTLSRRARSAARRGCGRLPRSVTPHKLD